MANYGYPTLPNTITFGARDALAPGVGDKIIKGLTMDPEFGAISVAINSKMNHENPVFTGIMNDGGSGGGTINGGTY
jgi:hypothetical protein